MQAEIFPNPSSGKLFVCGTEQWIKLSVFNDGGKEIYQSRIAKTQSVIDLGDQPKGVYFIEMHTSKEVGLRKIMLKK